MNYIITATANVTNNIFDAESATVSEHIYDATYKITRRINTIVGLAVAGVSKAGFEIVDT